MWKVGKDVNPTTHESPSSIRPLSCEQKIMTMSQDVTAFIAEFQNTRAEMTPRVRCALETLGKRSVGVVNDAIDSRYMLGTRLSVDDP